MHTLKNIFLIIFISINSFVWSQNIFKQKSYKYYPYEIIMGEDDELIDSPSINILPYDEIEVFFFFKNLFRKQFEWKIIFYKDGLQIKEHSIVGNERSFTEDPEGVEFTLAQDSFCKRIWFRDDLVVISFELNNPLDKEQTSILFVDNLDRLK